MLTVRQSKQMYDLKGFFGFKQMYLSNILILQMPVRVKTHLKTNMSLTCTVRGNTWSSSEEGQPLFWSLFHSLWSGTAETDRLWSQHSLVTAEIVKYYTKLFKIVIQSSHSRENYMSPP